MERKRNSPAPPPEPEKKRPDVYESREKRGLVGPLRLFDPEPDDDELTEAELKKKEKPLTVQQQILVREYLVDFKASKAGKRAGYKNIYEASTILRRPNVRYELKKLSKKLAGDKTQMVVRTLAELEAVSHSDITDFIVLGKDDKETTLADLSKVDTRAIASMDVNEELTAGKRNVIKRVVKIKLWDKTRTLETQAKITGLQTNNVNLSGSVDLKLIDLDVWKEKVKKRLLENKSTEEVEKIAAE